MAKRKVTKMAREILTQTQAQATGSTPTRLVLPASRIATDVLGISRETVSEAIARGDLVAHYLPGDMPRGTSRLTRYVSIRDAMAWFDEWPLASGPVASRRR